MIPPETLLQNRYLVQKQIGKGGMGLVYMATDQRFGSSVALKEIFLDAPHLLKAFEREARLLNHLRHSALPRVSDHFTEDDGQFIVMEFIPGPDLWEMLRARKVPFPLATVLDWADQLLDALEYLHTHDPVIIHRDIKPQNLKLTERNHIILLDFGLAKGTPSEAMNTATAAASVFGYSFNYAPLEQMQGSGTDPRSDLYSLGATLYHLLTNVTPPDALARATAVLNGEPDPLRPAHRVQAQVSAPVARVLMRAMAQSAAQRPQSAAEMREALREARGQTSAALLSSVVQPTAGVGASEQPVRLAAALPPKPGTVYQPARPRAQSQDALTVVESARLAGRAAPASLHSEPRESVMTKVRDNQPLAPERRSSGRTIGVLASVVLLLIIAGAVYTFTRPTTAKTTGVQTTPSPGDSPSTLATDKTQSPALSPASANAPAPAQAAGNSSHYSPRSDSVDDPASQPATPATTGAGLQPQPRETPAGTDAGPSALTPEAERARAADEIRRQRREREEEDIRRSKEEADRQRAREMEMQREREMRRNQPPPPGGYPPPPPPRRDGPRPF